MSNIQSDFQNQHSKPYSTGQTNYFLAHKDSQTKEARTQVRRILRHAARPHVLLLSAGDARQPVGRRDADPRPGRKTRSSYVELRHCPLSREEDRTRSNLRSSICGGGLAFRVAVGEGSGRRSTPHLNGSMGQILLIEKEDDSQASMSSERTATRIYTHFAPFSRSLH